jgi:hypothetical protein
MRSSGEFALGADRAGWGGRCGRSRERRRQAMDKRGGGKAREGREVEVKQAVMEEDGRRMHRTARAGRRR